MKGMKCVYMAGALMLLAASVSAAGVTNYYDDFSGSSATDLNGLAPDTRPGTETWAADTYKADGSFTLSGAHKNYSAYLAFTPVAGKVYTLSVDVTQPSGSSNAGRWAGLNFGNSTMVTSDGGPVAQWRNAATLAYRQSGQVSSFYGGDGTQDGNNSVTNLSGVSGTQTLKMVLDTTGDDWTVDYFIGSSSVGSHTFDGYPGDNQGTPYDDTRPIANVGISINGDTDFTATFDNFSLTTGSTPDAKLNMFMISSAVAD